MSPKFKRWAWLAAGDLAFIAGIALIVMTIAQWQSVNQFRVAPPCQSQDNMVGCYLLVPATVTDDSTSCSKNNCHDYLTLDFITSSQVVSMDGSNLGLNNGTRVNAKFYDDEITDVLVDHEKPLVTADNPIKVQGDNIFGGLVLTALGAIAVVIQGRAIWAGWSEPRGGTGISDHRAPANRSASKHADAARRHNGRAN